MNIIVCVKQVPDTTQIRLNPTALILKDKYGAKVTVVTMGPPQAKDILKDAIALGADEAYLLTDRVVAGSDTLATSMALAALVKNLGEYDLILCGREAADGCTAQVGPEMAEHLGIPQVTSALKVEFTDGRFVVERETENWAETLAVPAPLLVTMTRAEKELRFASIRGKMKARKTEIPVKTAAQRRGCGCGRGQTGGKADRSRRGKTLSRVSWQLTLKFHAAQAVRTARQSVLRAPYR